MLIAGLALLLVTVLLASAELGYRVGRNYPQADDAVMSQSTNWEGILLGLLALLIGFTFAMAVSRFDGRRELILDEANAIEKTLHMTGIVEEPRRGQVRGLLRRYVDARIGFYNVGSDLARTDTAHQGLIALQRQIWSQVISVGRTNPDSEMNALLVDSALELIALGARRRAAVDNHVPFTVLIILVVVAATGMAATGYSCGLHRRRLRFGMIVLPILIATVIYLVVDLDHPRSGFIKAGQGPMLRLQHDLAATPP